MLTGSCLCGAVRFVITAEPEGAIACHCGQCRKMSGHFWASTHAPDDALSVTGEVSWYASSDIARRGFCPVCGSFLFWKRHGADHTSLAIGALDAPTGLRLGRHIFTADKGDYYAIADGLPEE
jgi:hypothetical protein